MTAPAHAHEVPPPVQQDGQLRQVADLLLIGAAASVTAGAVAGVLALPVTAVLLALKLADHDGTKRRGTKTLPRPKGYGPTQRAAAQVEAMYRAAFLRAAAGRIATRLAAGMSPADAVAPERRYWLLHEQARRNRLEAARAVASVAEEQAGLQRGRFLRRGLGRVMLGWYAHEDDRVTPECRHADGRNFPADRAPLIGWPGTLHGGTCRCEAGPPFSTDKTVDDATRHLVGWPKRKASR